jgi:hypothetical protein
MLKVCIGKNRIIGDFIIVFYSLQLYFSFLAYLITIFDLLLLLMLVVTKIYDIEKIQSPFFKQGALY